MGHIHTGTGEYDFTVGAYVIRQTPNGYEALLHLHKKIGKWLPFGGHVELNESPWQAVLREVEEEAGYNRSQLKVIQPRDSISALTELNVLPQPLFLASYDYDDFHKHTDIAFAFLVETDPPGATSADESQDYSWFNISTLKDLTPEKAFFNTIEVYDCVLQLPDKGWEIRPVV